jgi:hypothetical protein
MPYTATPTDLPEVVLLEPKVFGNARHEQQSTICRSSSLQDGSPPCIATY